MTVLRLMSAQRLCVNVHDDDARTRCSIQKLAWHTSETMVPAALRWRLRHA